MAAFVSLRDILNDVYDSAAHTIRVDGAGGGGVPVTIVDGGDVTLGSIADVAVTGDNPGTVNAHLRGIDKVLTASLQTVLDADGLAPPTAIEVLAFPHVFNGTNSDRVKDMAAAQAQTTFTGIPAMAPFYLDTTGTPSTRRGVTIASVTSGVAGTQVPSAGSVLWDGTLFRPALGDTSGRTQVVGGAAAGAAAAGNPVLMAGWDGTLAQTLFAQVVQADAVSSANKFLHCAAFGYAWNGASVDRQRNNIDVTLLASASRTTTQTSADITTFNCVGISVFLNMTVVGTGSVTLSINGKDPASAVYYNLLTGAAVVSNVGNLYRIQLGIPAVANKDVSAALPRIIQIVVTANNANPANYSVGYTLHND